MQEVAAQIASSQVLNDEHNYGSELMNPIVSVNNITIPLSLFMYE